MTTRSQLFRRAPDWFHPGSSRRSRIPDGLHSWLFETGSLTRRVRDLCGGEFRLRVLQQDWLRPFADESRALRLRPSRVALVREVSLQCGEEPLVVARSIIPASIRRGAQHHLASLGNRPLGEVLFSDPKLRRLGLELAVVEKAERLPGSLDVLDTVESSERIWGRRSLYAIAHGNLLVAEFFLPSLLKREASL
ncbi:chorismate--pyruvate lyase family protein [Methylocaldum szegediense]|uniref:Probable chorismate pyruvate-lyase n=1 Tax=Methylocaldum szegediense TaxID=73780 RepID=A0ABM9HYY7_9GAMM|nr:chorismate lyase [Methylocaldum szegediense]CAI8778919.1 putative chorismate pyruvate-lyase [Methylocaldum szegediense]